MSTAWLNDPAPLGCMRTGSGAWFDPFDPDPSTIRVDDVARSLSRLCRYCGHGSHFYSVAEHSVHMAWWFLTEFPAQLSVARWALMHDASEAYLADMPHPIKHAMPDYRDMEAEVEFAVAKRFGLSWPCPPQVQDADRMIVKTEMRVLFGWDDPSITDELPVAIELWSPERAYSEFMKVFGVLWNRR